ncbi:MAG: hypothetical protein ACU0BF_06315 [Paracoccaceae bacterium]
MSHLRFALATAALILSQAPGGLGAQTLRTVGPPVPAPPAGFDGLQYVDSRGCVYIRAGVGDAVNYVPRVTRTREAICGVTESPGTQVARAPEPAPAPAPTPPAAPEPAAPAVQTVAAAPTAPAPRPAPTRAAAPAAAVVPRPAPVTVSAPAPVLPTAPVAPRAAPVGLPRSALCTPGLFGPQPAFVNARTGEVLDCGPAPVPAAAPARAADLSGPVPAAVGRAGPAIAPRPARTGGFGAFLAALFGGGLQVGPQAPTPAVAQAEPEVASAIGSVAAPQAATQGLRRVTRAEVCAEFSRTGRLVIDAATGIPVDCSMVRMAAVARAAPPAPALADSCAGLSPAAAAYLRGAGGGRVDCAAPPAGPDASTAVVPLSAARADSGTSQGFLGFGGPAQPRGRVIGGVDTGGGTILGIIADPFDPPIPASNPIVPANEVIHPPHGFERVWEDGRLNPHRGLNRSF